MIAEILNLYIATSTATFLLERQTVEEQSAWLGERSETYPAIVAEWNRTFAGWGSLSLFSPRGGYRHTAELSVYVRPDLHQHGIGRALVHELIVRARAAGHHTLIAKCCSESTASVALHETLGFTRVGELRSVGRKFDRWLDATIFQLLL